MKLIADSGSSKTEWRIIDGDQQIHQAKTIGLNPFHVPDQGIVSELSDELLPQLSSIGLEAANIREIYFYGSGCVPGPPSERMKKCLEKVFTHATPEVYDDLIAVARGLCGREEGIVAILGTGSNSGQYDGREIIYKVRALGYILGDEGSGSWIGKMLLAKYLRGELSDSVHTRLEERFSLTAGNVLDQVYRTPQASKYLAGFSRFVFQQIKDPQLYQMVYDGFRLFLEHNILKYPDHTSKPVHFSGSVAFYYANILRQAAADVSVRIGHIVEGPIAGLALYHKHSKETS